MGAFQEARVLFSLHATDIHPISLDSTALREKIDGVRAALEPAMDGRRIDLSTLMTEAKGITRETCSYFRLAGKLLQHGRLSSDSVQMIDNQIPGVHKFLQAYSELIGEARDNLKSEGKLSASEDTLVKVYDLAKSLLISL